MMVLGRLRGFWDNTRHVLSISYRPTRDELNKSSKLIILGILLVGVMGFIIAIVVSLIIAGNLSLI